MGPDRDRPRGEVTQLLEHVRAGDAGAADELLPLVYDRLRAMAGAQFKGQPDNHTLQPTALVHEAFVKLVNAADDDWNSRAHFCAVAARAMRQILHDHARRKRAARRGGDARRVPLESITTPSGTSVVDLMALDDALSRLTELEPRQSRLVELRFFGGLTNGEVADVLGLSTSMVEKDWRMTRAWLRRELGGGELPQ